ncbi:MAG TPA: hypothetical protein VI278_08335 [Nitrososphaeraceae archaeon]
MKLFARELIAIQQKVMIDREYKEQEEEESRGLVRVGQAVILGI